MDVVVKARHCHVSDQFRSYVEEKITRLEKLNDRAIRVEVEVSAEKNKRQHDQASRVEITLLGKGPVVRAEAAAEEKGAAFETALDRLMAQLRKAADRKKIHRGSRTPQSLSEATAELPAEEAATEEPDAGDIHTVAGMEVQGDGPLVVREKVHAATPMTLDQALHEMELVGHDFYLFVDAEHLSPSVVYRRRAYDYGVIRLDNQQAMADASAG
ncbi:ribosome-associated translation inhibitor RaiA [Microlunatus panaciterrae]|uniref:Ribosome hibernation promoting factor n=1 Tax=Microlunatus panaciterrae TaxID=400768 RepID=A0ABS2RG81_9ACTN|nr:ribosome-associated translation inhibitor RaiA [Microlunatus panaciterrae]MBM7797542.1 ribosomal subunit interface protein [Microlunatus panaciterrae]